ncbi:MAG TPA: alpha/beta hydrolase [Gaiellaceae bacterium]|nr:alpha/beta hydrolase [Gaiellaceae bacterium]
MPGATSTSSNNELRLGDGRILGYGEWGARDGPLVLGFHGGGLSRLAHYGDEAPSRAGLRLVLPDRPGFGLSDRRPDGSLLDWARDVGEFATLLGAKRFAVFGASAGGPGALACGYLLPDRVAAVGVVCGVGPYQDEPELAHFLEKKRQALVELARSDPDAALARIRDDCEAGVENAEALLDDWPPGTPDSDRRVMADAAIRARFVAALRESVARGPAGCVDETLRNYARAWGFALSAIQVPVHIWHGGRDRIVPVQVAELLADRIEGATLHVFPEEGHAIDYPHIDEILSRLGEAVDGR